MHNFLFSSSLPIVYISLKIYAYMEFSLLTSQHTLTGDIWQESDNHSRVIILLHGLGDHFGRYEAWSKRFNALDTAVIGVDLPGHGRSPGKRGHVDSYHVYNEIIDRLASFARSRYGQVSLGLYGHSLGGNIALNYLLTNSSGFTFSVITSPWIKLVNEPPPAMLMAARFMNHLVPRLLQPNGLKLEHISRAPDVNEKYSSDPLVHDRISVRLAVEAMKAADRILDAGDNINIPVLIVHGSDDMITSTAGSSTFSQGKENVSLKIWDRGYHELQNEAFNDEVFEYIAGWLKSV